MPTASAALRVDTIKATRHLLKATDSVAIASSMLKALDH